MAQIYREAASEYDTRSPDDSRTQPWREWWPRSRESGSTSNSLSDASPETLPWLTWQFDPKTPYEKPWLKWPMRWPSGYNDAQTAPTAVHEPEFIEVEARRQGLPELPSDHLYRTNTILQYFSPDLERDDQKPYVSKIPSPEGSECPQINFKGCYEKVMVTDARGHEPLFTLDKHGLEFVPQKSRTLNLSAPMDLESYMTEMKTWLCDHLKCQEVFIFDYALRTERKDKANGFVDLARRVHCDQSPRSAIGRIQLHMGDRAPKLLSGRCRLINIWRPLVLVVNSYPLAICPFPYTSKGDLVPVDIIFPHYAEEALEILPNPAQRWIFRSGATFEDVTLLKIFDSDNRFACYAPHSSFRDPRKPASSVPRSSIELRCLVFGDNAKPAQDSNLRVATSLEGENARLEKSRVGIFN